MDWILENWLGMYSIEEEAVWVIYSSFFNVYAWMLGLSLAFVGWSAYVFFRDIRKKNPLKLLEEKNDSLKREKEDLLKESLKKNELLTKENESLRENKAVIDKGFRHQIKTANNALEKRKSIERINADLNKDIERLNAQLKQKDEAIKNLTKQQKEKEAQKTEKQENGFPNLENVTAENAFSF